MFYSKNFSEVYEKLSPKALKIQQKNAFFTFSSTIYLY